MQIRASLWRQTRAPAMRPWQCQVEGAASPASARWYGKHNGCDPHWRSSIRWMHNCWKSHFPSLCARRNWWARSVGIRRQTAVGMGSQGSLIQVEHCQFLACLMGAAGTLEPWHGCLGVHLELIQWGPDYKTRRRWALLSDSTHGLMQNATHVTVTNKLCGWFPEWI